MAYDNRVLSRPALKVAFVAGSVLVLAACAHHGPPPTMDAGPPPRPPTDSSPAPFPPPPSRAPYAPVESQSSGSQPGSVRDFVVSAGDRVYFDLDQYTLTSAGRGVLDQQAQWLQRYSQVMVRIEGNCDERGTREYNLALGGRRAEAVRAYLVDRGVSPTRITTISYGKERPIDLNTGDEAYAHNRNGHTAITGGAAGGVGDGGG